MAQRSIQLRFGHGLGDHVQLTAVLRHLKKHRPEWTVDVACREGLEGLFRGLCRRAGANPRDLGEVIDTDLTGTERRILEASKAGKPFVAIAEAEGIGPGECHAAHLAALKKIGDAISRSYDQIIDLYWGEAQWLNPDCASTKIERCLREVFQLEPDPVCSDYEIFVTDAELHRAEILKRKLCGDRPLALIHNSGVSGVGHGRDLKNMPRNMALMIASALRDVGIQPVVCNWTGRDYVAQSLRCPLLSREDLGRPEQLAALASLAQICIGVDSGPGHIFAASAPLAAIYWSHHHPLNYFPASDRVLHIIPERHVDTLLCYEQNIDRGAQWAIAKDFFRANYRCYEYPEHPADGAVLGAVNLLLADRRYLDEPAADAQLQQWARVFSHSPERDRDYTLDFVFRTLRQRQRPMIVETGCIRMDHGPHGGDFAGAGYFSMLAAFFIDRTGGLFQTVDHDPDHCLFAQQRLRWFPRAGVNYADSVAFLRNWRGPRIDCLYLDSLDTDRPRHAEHALHEARAALQHLATDAIVVFDDSPADGAKWAGKGALAIPWLIDQGWRVACQGYQTVLDRSRQ